MAAISEFGGGLPLLLGLFMRPASLFLLSTMVVATAMHHSMGDPCMRYSHALEAANLFSSLIVIDPGKHSLDSLFFRKQQFTTITTLPIRPCALSVFDYNES